MTPARPDDSASSVTLPPGAAKPRKKSGSENRKRSALVRVRFTPEELTRLQTNATAASLTLSSYIGQKTINAPPPRNARRASPQRMLAGHYLGQLGKIGSNLNQIARAMNMNSAGHQDIEAALEYAETFKTILVEIIRGRD